MKTTRILMIFLIGGTSELALALDSQQSPQKSASLKPCAYQPCPNTPTGEDPAVIDMREQERREKSLQDGSDDIKRWKSIRLYSNTTEAHQLKLSIIKSSKFEMQLIPQKGLVRFSAPEMAVAFRIASMPGSKADVCPRYNLKVVEASSEHAVVRKSCPRYEYAPNRFHMDAEYFLIDWRSLTMRYLWFAVSSSKDAPFPDAKPPITVVPCAFGLLQKTEPYIILTDNVTSKKLEIPTWIPPRAKDITLAKLRRGKSTSVKTTILAQEISKVSNKNPIDINIEFTFDIPGTIPDTEEKISCIGQASCPDSRAILIGMAHARSRYTRYL